MFWALHLSAVQSRWIDAKMSRETLQCVGCVLLAVLAVLLTEVCCEEPGKKCDFHTIFSLYVNWSLEHHYKLTYEVLWDWQVISLQFNCGFIGLGELRLLAITVATDETGGHKRFMRSAKANNIDVKVSLFIHKLIMCLDRPPISCVTRAVILYLHASLFKLSSSFLFILFHSERYYPLKASLPLGWSCNEISHFQRFGATY